VNICVVGSGFEPLKAEPADLQSAPIGHSGNPPDDLDYKTLSDCHNPEGEATGMYRLTNFLSLVQKVQNTDFFSPKSFLHKTENVR
jgi:hypothetical protein